MDVINYVREYNESISIVNELLDVSLDHYDITFSTTREKIFKLRDQGKKLYNE
jgi:hypothetical protein